MSDSRVANDIVDTIGSTPIIRLGRVIPANGVQLYGKVEARNPAGSVKERIGVGMIRAAEAHDLVASNKTFGKVLLAVS